MIRDNAKLFFILPVLVFINLFAMTTYASDLDNGKTLHDAHCRSCHKSIMSGDPDSIYVRENRRIDSYSALQNQVNRCETNIGIAWPQEQINDVVDYINQQFYQFKK